MHALLDALSLLPLPTTGGAQRLFHGRGGLHPGGEHLALDWFAPVLLLTAFAPVAADDAALLCSALQSRWQHRRPGEPFNLVLQQRHGGRSDTQVLAGSVPEPHTVQEDESRYGVHLLRGQNHGLFLDMAEGRRWVRLHISARAQPGAPPHSRPRVLNLFAYTCAFSVVALQAGARQVVNLDMSRGALASGQQNHALNGITNGAAFLAHDLFTSWGKVTRSGPYDLVIVDPPSYQKGSFVATKDYPRLMRRLPGLLAPGGHALLCLNAPELPSAFVQDHMQAQAAELAFVQRLPNPPAFADADEERALKVLVYRAPGLG